MCSLAVEPELTGSGTWLELEEEGLVGIISSVCLRRYSDENNLRLVAVVARGVRCWVWV